MACGEYVFSPVELIQDVGPFVKGTKFDSAFVDYANGILAFYNGDIKIAKFNLELTIKSS